MAWNEPNNSGSSSGSGGDDPWSARGGAKDARGGAKDTRGENRDARGQGPSGPGGIGGPGGRRPGGPADGPPDLDEVLRNLSKKLNEVFGGSGGGSGKGGSGAGRGLGHAPLFILGFLALLVVWALFGFYRVDQFERVVILRLGVLQEQVAQPGLNWNPPIIDEIRRVNINNVYTRSYVNRAMLTTDENIIDIRVDVQYRINDPVSYHMEIRDPEGGLDNAAESAIRHVVGGNPMDQIFTTGREQVAVDVARRLQNYINVYLTGIEVVSVNLNYALPPEAVRPAFDDVNRAREDEDRVQDEARQYANRVIPEARGEAARQIEQANAYKQETIARASGDAARFDQLLEEYQKAPQVTRQRLYIESMQDVMTAASKVMIDVEGGNNMLYVPLDRLLQERGPLESRPTTAQEWRSLAEQLRPYLPATGSADTSRLNDSRTSSRGTRP